MFDEVLGHRHSPGARVRGLVRLALRRRWPRGALGSSAIALGVAALGAAWALQAAGPDPCMTLQRADLTIDELVAVKRKMESYEQDPVGTLELSAKEATFILADYLKFPVWIEAEGEQLFAFIALPDAGRCYNIAFRGQVQVDQGVAHVTPRDLRVGHLDLGRWVGGRGVEIRKADLTGGDASRVLAQTRSLRVHDGRLQLQIDDPGSLR